MRVVVADDQTVVREGLVTLLETMPGIEAALDDVVPSASSGSYITPGKFHHLRGKPIVAEASPLVVDAAIAEQLWQYATEVTKQHSQ